MSLLRFPGRNTSMCMDLIGQNSAMSLTLAYKKIYKVLYLVSILIECGVPFNN